MQTRATIEVVTEGDALPTPEELAAVIAARVTGNQRLGYRIKYVIPVNNA